MKQLLGVRNMFTSLVGMLMAANMLPNSESKEDYVANLLMTPPMHIMGWLHQWGQHLVRVGSELTFERRKDSEDLVLVGLLSEQRSKERALHRLIAHNAKDHVEREAVMQALVAFNEANTKLALFMGAQLNGYLKA